jgi:hypothetical protein
MEKEKKINWEQGFFFLHHRRVSAVKTLGFVRDRLSYVVLIDHWCNIVLNVHAPSEEKSDDPIDSFYEELEQIFNNFRKYHMKILSVDFNANVGSENIFNLTIGSEGLHQESNDNGVRIVNCAT